MATRKEPRLWILIVAIMPTSLVIKWVAQMSFIDAWMIASVGMFAFALIATSVMYPKEWPR